MPQTQISKLPIRIHRDQREALERVAIERDTTATALIRDAVAALTGVADPLHRYPRRDKRT